MFEQCFGWGWFPFGFFFLFIVLLFVLSRFWWGGRSYGRYHDWHRDPLEYLKARYAKGDITKEEFDRLKKEIKE